MPIRNKELKIILIPAFIAMAGMFVSCVNDLESIRKVTFHPDDPDEKTTDLYLTYTDSGYAKIRLYAKLAESFSKPQKMVKFKDGVKVEFYDDEGLLASILTAKYGEINEEVGMMLVRDSVRLYNTRKKQTMETEALYWKRSDSTIYTDKLVTIRTPRSLFFGKGVKTKQDFSWYEFLQPQGRLDIEENR